MLSKEYIEKLVMGQLPDSDVKNSLLALTPDKIDVNLLNCFVETIQQTGIKLPSLKEPVIDCSGTGGSGISRYNTSTAVAFVLAAAGLKVVKFGNRAMTGKTGSSDLLEALGFPLYTPLDETDEILAITNLLFLFAPQIYPRLGHLSAMRKSLRVKTIFNYLGPLLNPYKPAFRIMGVSDARMQQVISDYLSQTGQIKSAFVVRSENNLDEISARHSTEIIEIEGTVQRRITLHRAYSPEIQITTVPQTATESATAIGKLFHGEDTTSEFFHLVSINAGAAFYVAGVSKTIDAGRNLAEKLLTTGKVLQQLEHSRRAYAEFDKCA